MHLYVDMDIEDQEPVNIKADLFQYCPGHISAAFKPPHTCLKDHEIEVSWRSL